VFSNSRSAQSQLLFFATRAAQRPAWCSGQWFNKSQGFISVYVTYAYIYTHTYIYIHTHICIHMYMCIYTYTHTHTHTHTHTPTHTFITHTHTRNIYIYRPVGCSTRVGAALVMSEEYHAGHLYSPQSSSTATAPSLKGVS
jgi:hypothetical protein